MSTLPTEYAERKELQLYSFMFEYFPDAWLEIVRVAVVGNRQHNPGEPLHWARGKSMDQMNTAFRHIFDYGTGTKIDTDGCYHLAKAAWRLMAQLQLDIEAAAKEKGAVNRFQVARTCGHQNPWPSGGICCREKGHSGAHQASMEYAAKTGWASISWERERCAKDDVDGRQCSGVRGHAGECRGSP